MNLPEVKVLIAEAIELQMPAAGEGWDAAADFFFNEMKSRFNYKVKSLKSSVAKTLRDRRKTGLELASRRLAAAATSTGSEGGETLDEAIFRRLLEQEDARTASASQARELAAADEARKADAKQLAMERAAQTLARRTSGSTPPRVPLTPIGRAARMSAVTPSPVIGSAGSRDAAAPLGTTGLTAGVTPSPLAGSLHCTGGSAGSRRSPALVFGTPAKGPLLPVSAGDDAENHPAPVAPSAMKRRLTVTLATTDDEAVPSPPKKRSRPTLWTAAPAMPALPVSALAAIETAAVTLAQTARSVDAFTRMYAAINGQDLEEFMPKE